MDDGALTDEAMRDAVFRQEVRRIGERIDRLRAQHEQTQAAQRLALTALLLVQQRGEREQRRPWWRRLLGG